MEKIEWSMDRIGETQLSDAGHQAQNIVRLYNGLNRVIDWLTAHDERDKKHALLVTEAIDRLDAWNNIHDEREAEAWLDKAGKKIEQAVEEVFTPSIEQELEAGLADFPDKHYRSCTRIFLPEAKWDKWFEEPLANMKQIKKGFWAFHDIPVFSYGGDEIIYCTD